MRCKWTPGARQQYDDIWAEQGSFEAIQRLERRVNQAEAMISMFPESAPQYSAFDRNDIRMLVVGNYKLIYQIEDQEVRIISFLHGRSGQALD